MKQSTLTILLLLLSFSLSAQKEDSLGQSLRARFDDMVQKNKENSLRTIDQIATDRTSTVTDYSPYAIPLSEGTSSTGARTYSLPIQTAPGLHFVPKLAIAYNSQAGNGLAGWGWDISGISCITITDKTPYYDGEISSANTTHTGNVYYLDGLRLVRNTNISFSDYQYETESGHIFARMHFDSDSLTTHFDVVYPDGRRATFGDAFDNVARDRFPITQISDPEGNLIRFSYLEPYSFNQVKGVSRERIINKVEYGFREGETPRASITFNTITRSDYTDRFHAGVWLKNDRLISSITCYSDSLTLCEYNLAYSNLERNSFLRRIDYTLSGSCLPPLEFTYNADTVQTSPSLTISNTIVPEEFFSDYDNFVYIRGKFVPEEYTDGIIIYPKYTEGIIPSYGSPYPQNGKILIVPSLKNDDQLCRVIDDITFGTGFQALNAVDVDGDGTDEIVKVNYNGFSGNRTKLKITVYKYSTQSQSFISSDFTVTVAGKINILIDDIPYNRIYQWGDFLGNGRIQLLAISLKQSVYWVNTSSKAALIDISNQSLLSEEYVFDLTPDGITDILAYDFDSDSQTELCRQVGDSLLFYSSSNQGHFELKKTFSGFTTKLFPANEYFECFLTDINADGYIDIVTREYLNRSDIIRARYFNGTQYTNADVIGTIPHYSEAAYSFLDLNHDYFPDLILANGTSLTAFLNVNGQISDIEVYTSPAPISDIVGIIPCNLLSLWDASCFIKHNGTSIDVYTFTSNQSENRLLISSVDSFGKTSYNIYMSMPDIRDYMEFDTGFTPDYESGFQELLSPIYMLMMEGTDIGAGSQTYSKLNEFRYFHPVINTRGLGFCGFERITTYDLKGGTTIINDTHNNPHKKSVPVTDSIFVGLNNLAKTITYTFDDYTTTYGKLNPRLTQSVETNALTGVTTTTTVSGYDSYDYPLGVVTAVQSGNDAPQTRTSVHTWQHAVSDSLYLLGLPSREVVESDADGNDASVHLVRTDSQFDARGHVTAVQQYVGEGMPGSLPTNLVQNKLYAYDAFGNVISEKTAAYGATTFNETSFTYDSLGRYLVSSTDPMGRTTTYSGYDKFGNPASVTDHAGLTTSYTYDAWGNLTQTTLPDGTVQTTTRAWSGSSEPGLYRVTTTASGQPDTKAWYDALGREVRSASQRFDGSWQYVTTEYDSRGRLTRVSLPYKNASSGPSLWNSHVYDDYDRPTRYTTASGNQTRWSYSGLSTITVKDGLSSTSTTDASGNVVQVSDAGGTITYALRDDGQPSSVTVTPPSTSGLSPAVTTFQYDMYGRRTAIVDPSAGTRTDAYTDNADGTSSVAHAGPNGTVTSYYDRFGRVTSVTRPEFNTSYTYNTAPDSPSFGSLLSEVSANGTSKAFIYDSLGRTASVTEHSCDSLFLTKAYTYGAGSNVAAIAYSTQDGPVTTETYHYAYGHNTKITLPDGTKVFQLTSEDALGLPTAVTTGSAQRIYGYTAAGLPTSRGISRPGGTVIQDLGYSYDAATGNLASRSDRVLSSDGTVTFTEEFAYDNLNRLREAQMNSVLPAPSDTSLNNTPPYIYDNISAGYDERGNVLSHDKFMAEYGETDPYAFGYVQWSDGEYWMEQYMPRYAVPMTSFDRPVSVADTLGGMTSLYAEYEYDASGRKAHSSLPVIGLERHYLGGVFERDERSWGDPDDPWGGPCGSEMVQRLFLGGNAYNAPMVLAKVNDGPWTPYNIGRDTQGSITHVMTADGELLERYVYDPWGKVAQADSTGYVVDTLCVNPWGGGGFWSKIVGSHGYTGHEYIVGCGLINANARIYDPFLGRFLSPDPLIQDPASTQNFNRYAYCLNNPLKYTDEDGEFVVLDSFLIGLIGGGMERAKQMAENDIKIWGGLLATNTDNLFEATGIILSRFTWELPQTLMGLLAAHSFNTFRLYGGVESVEYLHGATVTKTKKNGFGAFTLGSYITGDNSIEADARNDLFQHEFGHVLQSRLYGLFYIPRIAVPSLIDAVFNDYDGHNRFYTEQDANVRALRFFINHYDGFTYYDPSTLKRESYWDFKSNPVLSYPSTQKLATRKPMSKWVSNNNTGNRKSMVL